MDRSVTVEGIRQNHERSCIVCRHTMQDRCAESVLLEENERLLRLLGRAMQYVPCDGPSIDPCVRCQMSRTLTGHSVHLYPGDQG